jgi:hypothetical protein
MDKEVIVKELEATRAKLAALEVLLGEGKVSKKKATGEKEGATKRVVSEKEAAKKVAEALDDIALILEKEKDPLLLKLAYEIDMVSDVLEGKREASTLESDVDEKFMKKYFQCGAFETDKDEPYMKEFNTDTSSELQTKYKKNQLGKDASDLPYKVIK